MPPSNGLWSRQLVLEAPAPDLYTGGQLPRPLVAGNIPPGGYAAWPLPAAAPAAGHAYRVRLLVSPATTSYPATVQVVATGVSAAVLLSVDYAQGGIPQALNLYSDSTGPVPSGVADLGLELRIYPGASAGGNVSLSIYGVAVFDDAGIGWNTGPLRLEVAADPTPTTNRLANPDGSLGGYGWVSPVDGSLVMDGGVSTTDGSRYGVKYTWNVDSGTVGQYFYSTPFPLTAGEYVEAAWVGTSGTSGSLRARLDFLTVGMAGNGQTAWVTQQQAVKAAGTIAATAIPAGTGFGRIRFEVGNSDGSFPVSGGLAQTGNVLVAGSSVVAGLQAELPASAAGASPDAAYTDILGDSHDIAVTREALDVGTLQATIVNPALDPATSDLLRPGRPFRLRGYDPTAGFFRPLMVGTLTDAHTDYVQRVGQDSLARITLTGVDGVADLANATRPDTVASIGELPYVLEGCGVPWQCNGSTAQVATAAVVVANDDATALDQLLLTRDTVKGVAWLRQDGVLVAADTVPAPDGLNLLDDRVYGADLPKSFDTDRCVNSVTIKRLWTHPTDGPQGTVYGPYEDAASIQRWGRHAAQFTVAGVLPDDIPGYAAAVLAANATPQVAVGQVQVPVVDLASLEYGLLDLYAKVQVGADPTVRRVVTVGYEIAADPDHGGRWLVSYGFADDGLLALPISQPPVQTKPAGSGVTDTDGTGSSTYLYPTGTTPGDIDTMTQTISVVDSAEQWQATAYIDADRNPTTGASTFVGELWVDGTAQVRQALLRMDGGGRLTASQTWLLTGMAAGDHVLKVTGRLASSGGGWTIRPTRSTLLVARLT